MLGAVRGGLLLALAAVVAAGLPGCWSLGDCPATFHGLKDGDQLTSTILGPYAEQDAGKSCGNFGDLPAGTTLTWTAHPLGSSETCDSELSMAVSAVSSGSLSVGGPGGDRITLPNGCSANWALRARPLNDSADFLANDLERPSWYIERYLSPTAATCVPGGVIAGGCTDHFVATSTRP